MTYIIAVANEKGGVAKTTTTLSLGGAFAEMGKRVLLIDLDPQSNLSLSLGIEPEQKVSSIINLILDHSIVMDCIKKTKVENLDLLPSNSDIRMAERLLPTKSDYHLLLRNLLIPVNNHYDYILMDCPPFLGAITLNALIAANILIIPTQSEYYSVFALRNMMALIRQVRTLGNPDLRYRLLLTMFDKRTNLANQVAENAEKHFKDMIFNTRIPRTVRLSEAPSHGKPILLYDPSSPGAESYLALAKEVLNGRRAKQNVVIV